MVVRNGTWEMTAVLTRRQLLEAAGIGSTAALLAACSSGGSPSTSSATGPASGDLQVWDWLESPDDWGVAQQKKFYKTYLPGHLKKVKLSSTLYGYTDMLPKITTAWRGGTTPDAARLAIAWSPQFVNQGVTAEIKLSDLGLTEDDFWPQALQTVRKSGASTGDPLYGIPSNNEAMMLVYNKGLFQKAGLDPSKGPATWKDLAAYAKEIHSKTGKYGFGMPAAQNNGNTPYRFVPVMWAYGSSILDELDEAPTWKKVGINSAGTIDALTLYNQMFNIDKSTQPSAISDQESDVATLFAQGKVAMMIDHPSAVTQVRSLAPKIKIGADLIPKGPARRAVVFGGSNLHINAKTKNMSAAVAYLRSYLAPEWNTNLAGLGSNPGNRQGLKSEAQKKKLPKMPFNDVTVKMMPYGVNVPLLAQGAQIWNTIIPDMIQAVLTKQNSPKQAVAEAETSIKKLLG